MLKFLRGVVIAQIVQGALEGAWGLLYVAVGVFGDALPPTAEKPPGATDEGTMIAIGVTLVAVGVLRIVAGIGNFRFRHYGLGIAALCAGLLSVCGCICALTGIVLFGVGLYVYLHRDVREAFEMGRRGTPVAEIEAWMRGEAPGQVFD